MTANETIDKILEIWRQIPDELQTKTATEFWAIVNYIHWEGKRNE